MASQPPAFEERRAPERRRFERRVEDRTRYVRTAAAAAVSVCGGLALLYLFFALMGAVDFGEAAVASVVALVFALVWLAAYLVRSRAAARDIASALATKRDRERRGF